MDLLRTLDDGNLKGLMFQGAKPLPRGASMTVHGDSLAWLAGGGEMGARIRAKDWSASPLGRPETWSQSVQTAVSICLNSRFPVALWLGPDLRLVYNDPYIPFLGETKHPAMLGAPGREAWGEIWAAIGPMHDEVAARRATLVEDLQLFFARKLPREEVYVTFGYSPILASDGLTIEGTFDACTETTAKVVGQRRLATLRDLGARSAEQRTAEVACRDTAEVLRGNPLDIPFAAIYLLDENGASARRVAGTRWGDGSTVFPEHHQVIDGGAASGPWPLRQVAQTNRSCQISNLPGTVGVFHASPWPDAVETAFILPLAAPTQPRPAGFLIVGVSPRRTLDSDYRSFLELVAGHIATNIADARAFEAERRRVEALAEIDRAKTAFFSNVSHEFRTPLTLLMSPIEEVLAEPTSALASEHRKLLHVAHRNSLRLLRLVNTLLDFSRVEAGRMQASYQPVDLAFLTADLASNFRSAFDRAGLALEVHCPPLKQPVYVDEEMWEKIVLNLISNAFKFTLEGRVEVAVGADGPNATLIVSDTGVGIPETGLPRIFERFHRVEGQPARTHEGTGIGLALVQELVRMHEGEILVRSNVGKGTTFIVKVPFGRDHLPADRVQAPRLLKSTAIGAEAFVEEALRWLPSGGAAGSAEYLLDSLDPQSAADAIESDRSRVLVVDDNADMRDHLRHLLAKWWDVESASDGQEAFEMARRTKPDLIIADIMMPRLDGIELLRVLRRDPNLQDVPVILLSARAGEEARVEGLQSGADDYVIKPFSARELIARVRTNLSLSRVRTRQLEEVNRRLLSQIEQRELAEAELQQMQRLDAIGQITCGVAHDFNNLLSVVLANASLLSRNMRNSDDQEGIELICAAAERGVKLTGQLLSFSRKQRLKPEAVDLNRRIVEMRNLLSVTLGGTIKLETKLAADLWPALVDPTQIELIVLNLAINARDAMQSGGILTLETFNTVIEKKPTRPGDPAPGDYVGLAVKDTGSGIPDDALPHVFEPFFTTKEPGKGSGLGLAQVFGFAKQSGGGVHVDTRAGEGTSVKVFFPRIDVAIDVREKALAAIELRPQAKRKLNILVVDDDKAVLKSIVRLLDILGHAALPAESGDAALHVIENNTAIDLVLADIAMPEMTGIELASVIHATRLTLPVIVMTGGDQAVLKECGEMPVLQKPFSEDDLAAKIAEISKL